MTAREKTVTAILTLVILGVCALAIFGIIRVIGPIIANATRSLNAATMAGIGAMILSAWIIARGLSQRSRQADTTDRAALYCQSLANLMDGAESSADRTGSARHLLERRLALLARRGVLDRYHALRALGSDIDVGEASVRSALERLLVEMRKDLGHTDGPFPPPGLVDLAVSQSRAVRSPAPAGARIESEAAAPVRDAPRDGKAKRDPREGEFRILPDSI